MLTALARHAALLVLLLACLGLGVSRTAGLTWPHDADLYRNMAQAQTITDGDLFGDPYYRGEKAWYNPLTPALVALLHRLTGLEVPRLYAQAGAYLNLVVPIGFYVLANAFFGRLTASLATFYILFLGHPGEASWMRPAYGPWLFAGTFGQVFFYMGLVAYVRALRDRLPRGFVLTGALLGLAFLSHTAPALLLGGVIAAEMGRRLMHRARGSPGAEFDPRLKEHLLLFGVAVVVAAPFLATILGVYYLRVVNAAGNDWFWWPFELRRFGPYVASQFSVAALLAAGGLLLVGRTARKRLEHGLVLAWLVLAAALVLYGVLGQWAAERGVHLLNVVAPHHFWLYLKAAAALGWAYALAALVRPIWARRPRWGLEGRASLLLALAAAVGAAAGLPSLDARKDFARARKEALRESGKEWRDRIRLFLRSQSDPGDVVLADPDDALLFVGPAGRKTVAVLANFANPYVAWGPRAADASAMLEALRRRDGETFLALASRYRVAFVLHRKAGPLGLDRRALPFLVRELREGPFVLYRVRR